MAKAQPIAGLDPDDPILASACLIIETRLGEMLNFEPYIENPDRVYELHQMRIAAKRLRYSMEIFHPVYCDFTPFGKEFEKATGEIKGLQEHLGEIHDADVLVPRLEQHLGTLLKQGHGRDKRGEPRAGVDLVDLDACQGLLTICLQVRDEREDRYRRFLNDWSRLRESRFFDDLTALIKQSAGLSVAPPTAEVVS